MHLTQIGYVQQYQIRGADSTVPYWTGGCLIGQAFNVINVGTAPIPGGVAVKIDTTSTFTRDENGLTSDPDSVALYGAAVAAAADVGFLGICVDVGAKTGVTIVANTQTVRVAGLGSLGAVRTTNGTLAVGSAIIGSATAQLCTGNTTPTIGTVLGTCVKAVAQIGTSGLYTAGCYVSPR